MSTGTARKSQGMPARAKDVGATLDEIAAVLGVSRQMVEKILKRALAKVKARLEAAGVDGRELSG